MNPESWPQVKAVFEEAASLPPTQRAAFLAQACGPDASLRAEVESLLAANDSAQSFLAEPPLPLSPPGSSLHLTPGQMLGRYRVVSLLGSGGMGEVYRAEDTRLGRNVALKLLPLELSEDPDRLQRLEREARTASRLAHPNVCVIYEIADTDDGQRFIAMEYVEGESLRATLDRHGHAGTRMPAGEAIGLAMQIAAGLGAAHAAGIVHRDIKPENVMRRPDGLVKVLDFGVAKLTAAEPLREQLVAQTEPGTMVGTVSYMSPEQVRGLPVDSRSDGWSLGVLLFELLTGKRPFGGETAADVMVSILDRAPHRLAEFAPELPEALQRVMDRALSKSPEARYATMQELVSDLQLSEVKGGEPPRRQRLRKPIRSPVRIGALVAVVGALTGVALFGLLRAGPRPSKVRLAVLPFQPVGGPLDTAYAEDVSDRVRANLMSLPGLAVASRGSSRPYASTREPASVIGRELGMDFLLSGTAGWREASGEPARIALTARLVSASSASVIWQESFESPLDQVFETQYEVAVQVARRLGIRLADSVRAQLGESPTRNAQAYEAYLLGQQAQYASASENDPPSLRRAIVHYRQAIALDSDYVEAWAYLSKASSALYDNAPPNPAIDREAREAAERALALAPRGIQGYLALAAYHTHVTHEPARVLLDLAKVRELRPRDVDVQGSALLTAGYLEKGLGLWDSAAVHLERAHALAPRELLPLENLAEVELWRRQYPRARRAADQGLALLPTNLSLIQTKVMIAVAEGDLAGARAVLAAVPKAVDSAKVVAWMAEYNELMWVLNDAQQRLLLRLRPEAFGDDRGDWGLALAQTLWLAGDRAKARIYADSARMAYAEHVRENPDDAVYHIDYGLSLAILGRRTAAVLEGVRGAAQLPIRRDHLDGPYVQHQLARLYILVGEPEKAMDQLELLLQIPFYLSPAWLRVDPNFDPLRASPRFQKLIGQGG
ncbi:MAG TPA: protein kinase [Gemmatimonadales bacterium]|jgi:serine/threonine-protein kinase